MTPPGTTAAFDTPRAVEARHAFLWYEEAMRLFKLAPLTWCVLGFITLATDFGLQLIPGMGIALSKIIVPLIECGMLIGALALDRGEPLLIRYCVAAFGARPGAVAAIVIGSLVVFAAEALAAYVLADANLLLGDPESVGMSAPEVLGVVVIGVLASLPVAFVPFAVLFRGASLADAFIGSLRAFSLNLAPLLIYAALAAALVALGLLLLGIGLIAVFPLLSAASYASWKDIFAVDARER